MLYDCELELEKELQVKSTIKRQRKRIAELEKELAEMTAQNVQTENVGKIVTKLAVLTERERILDGIDECPGLTMAQDKWLSDMVRSNAGIKAAERSEGRALNEMLDGNITTK